MPIDATVPWLNTRPAEFTAAAESGARLGLQSAAEKDAAAEANARIALEAKRLAQETAADQFHIAMADRQLADAEKKTAMDAALGKEQLQKNFLLRQQQNNILDAYRTAQLGIAKQKLDDTAKQAATVAAHKQGYVQAIASGKSPVDAANMYPLALTPGVLTQISKPAPAPKAKPTDYQTVSERFPGKPAEDAVDESGGFFGIGAHPAKPAVPAVPAKTISYKVPVSGSPPDNSPASVAMRFLRDESGNLVPAEQ